MKLVFVMLSVMFVTTNLWAIDVDQAGAEGNWFAPNCPECQKMQQARGYGRLKADTAHRPGVVVKKKTPVNKKAGQK